MVITDSYKPVVVAVGAFQDQEGYTFTVNVKPVERDKLLDTNAAGDSFVGGFLAKLCML